MEAYNIDMGSTTLGTLKRMVGTGSSATYTLKVTARKRFREMGYRNYVQIAEVFVELYVASFRTKHAEDWLFKTYEWWLEHHGLGRRVVEHARRDLKDLKLIEERHGRSNRVEYRLIPANTIEVLFPEGPEDAGMTTGYGVNQRFSSDHVVQTSSDHVVQTSSDHDRQTLRREEEKKKKSVGVSPTVSPPHHTASSQAKEQRDLNGLDADTDSATDAVPVGPVSRLDQGSHKRSREDDQGERCVTALEDVLQRDGLAPLTPEERSRFVTEFEYLVAESGLTDDEIRGGPLRRMLERWEHIHLLPSTAYEDAAKRGYLAMTLASWRKWREHGGDAADWVDGFGPRYEDGTPINSPYQRRL